MAENNENTSRTPSEGNEAGSAERKRRRGHRGGRNHKHHREGAPAPVEAGAQAPAQNAPAENKSEGKGEGKKPVFPGSVLFELAEKRKGDEKIPQVVDTDEEKVFSLVLPDSCRGKKFEKIKFEKQ